MMDQLVEAHRAGRHAYLEQEVCAVASAAGLVTGALDGHHIGFMEWSQLPEHMATIEEFRRVCDATQRAIANCDDWCAKHDRMLESTPCMPNCTNNGVLFHPVKY